MIMTSLRDWLLSLPEVAALEGVYISFAAQDVGDHVLITRIDTNTNLGVNGNDPLAERISWIDIDTHCSTYERAATVATAIFDAIKNYTGTMGADEILAVEIQDERDQIAAATKGTARGRSIVELETLITHRKGA